MIWGIWAKASEKQNMRSEKLCEEVQVWSKVRELGSKFLMS